MPRQQAAPGTDLPGPGTLIQVFGGESDDESTDAWPVGIPSRVDDVVPGASTKERSRLMIAAPYYVGDVEPPEMGSPFAVVWASARKMLELPTTLVGDERENGRVRVWWMEVIGPAVHVQRRNFGRVPIDLPVQVSPLVSSADLESAEDSVETRHGRTVDLSEGGMFCTLPPPAFEAGAAVVVELAVDDGGLRLPAVVLRSIPSPDRPGAKSLVSALQFENPDEYGDVLRRVVFAEQLRIRRAGLL